MHTPDGLTRALDDRSAVVTATWREGKRTYLTAESFEGPLFARHSTDPSDVPVLKHEAAVRRMVGSDGALRTPPVLGAGDGWMLEVRKRAGLFEGPECVDAAVAAAADIPRHALPVAYEPAVRGSSMFLTARRRSRVALSALPVRDLARARDIIERCELPRVTSHGDFHVKNVLISDGAAWVVDWELTAIRPAGFDLMQLWATLPAAADRQRLWDATLDLIGTEHRRELAELRYALVVRTAANKLGAPERFNRDRQGARRLLALLASVRDEAVHHANVLLAMGGPLWGTA